jgi:hypothetical protein
MSTLPGFHPPPAALDMDGAACTTRLLNQLSRSGLPEVRRPRADEKVAV